MHPSPTIAASPVRAPTGRNSTVAAGARTFLRCSPGYATREVGDAADLGAFEYGADAVFADGFEFVD